jgi:CheY-like chemotaxis protein
MPLHIYYLDDEELLCENFVDYFASKDVVVTTFVDPKVALAAAKQSPPDMMFIDFRLPGTTGDEVAKALDPSLPKFLVTGDILVNTEYRFEKIFPKPYDEAAMAALIATYLAAKTNATRRP